MKNQTIITLFEEIVHKYPQHIALKYGQDAITYDQLQKEVTKIASNLRQKYLKKYSKPMPNETCIGISFERNSLFVSIILGILKAGGCYVPIDKNYPKKRVEYILENCQAPFVFTDSSQAPINKVLNYQDLSIPPPLQREKFPKIHSQQSAYIIYTSGSTGKPKGVVIEHRSLLNLIADQKKRLNIKKQDRILQFSSIGFDACVWEIFNAILNGACLCIPKEEERISEELLDYLHKERISLALLPPIILKNLKNKGFPHLKNLVTGGDICTEDIVKEWTKNSITLWNAYGPTESTVCATIHRCSPQEASPPIGSPLDNISTFILDNKLKPVSQGQIGELCLGGKSLAREYYRSPQLNNERFIYPPFKYFDYHSRIYRTGDLVKQRRDGIFEYIGRKDHQIKIRGFRIEIEEVESILRSFPSIQDAVTIADGSDEQKMLHAFIIPLKDFKKESLALYLKKELPTFMLPSSTNIVKNFPITPHGKIDRQHLLKLRKLNSTPSCNLEINELQKQLRHIWCKHLQASNTSIDEDFLQLGGNSLIAMKIIAEIKKKCGVSITMRDFFNMPSIRKQSTYLGK